MLLLSKWKFKWKVPQGVTGYISLQGWLTLLVSTGADFIGLVSVAVDTGGINIATLPETGKSLCLSSSLSPPLGYGSSGKVFFAHFEKLNKEAKNKEGGSRKVKAIDLFPQSI